MKNIEKLITKEELDKELEYLDNNLYDMTGTGSYIDNDLKDFLTENLSEAIDYYYEEQITVKSSDKVPPIKDEYEEITEFIISFYK